MTNDFIKWFESEYEGQDDIYEFHLDEKPSINEFKFIFLSDYIFDVITYDENLSYEFGKKIYEVMKAIQEGKTFDYIIDNYKNYIIVCNLLDKFELIDWGTSVRGAWFNGTQIIKKVGCWKFDGTAVYENPVININELIEWLEVKE